MDVRGIEKKKKVKRWQSAHILAATFLFHVCDLPQEQTEWLASADGGGSSKDADSGDTARLLGRVSWCACMLGIHLRAR